MDILQELAVFGGQVLLVVVAFLVVRRAISRRDGLSAGQGRRRLRVDDLSERYENRGKSLREFMNGGPGAEDGGPPALADVAALDAEDAGDGKEAKEAKDGKGAGAKAGGKAGESKSAEGAGDAELEVQAAKSQAQAQAREKARGGAGRRRRGLFRRRKLARDGRPCVFVFDFRGDLQASSARQLGELVTAVLSVAREGDEALCRLQSPGGVVDGYGLVAAELMRFRAAGVRLTVAVDRVAASGGYLAACVADRILAAPFAYIGSIGVYLGLPNLHRLLQRYDVDFETVTAGDRKRSLTVFGENTDEARALAREQVDRVHSQFKGFIAANRPALDVERVADGDVWSAQEALELGMVDGIGTSAQCIQDLARSHRVLQLSWDRQRDLAERMFGGRDPEDD